MLALVSGSARAVAALGAAFVVGLSVSACGGGVPSSAVATVSGTPISNAAFNHWMSIAAASSQQQGGTKTPVPVPPDYKACVAGLKAQTASVKGATTPTDAQLKAQCATEYTSLQQQVMQFLISADWVIGEAADQGVKVTDAAVRKQLDTERKQQFPTQAAFTKFMQQTGETTNDLLLRVKLQQLSTKIRTKVTGAQKVTASQIASYYNAHKSTYTPHETRNVQIILVRTQAQAQAAINAIKGGTSFANEAKKVSIDVASKSEGGYLNGVTRGEEEQALDNALFTSPVGKLGGPVKTPFGYYVYQVLKIIPGNGQTLQQATPGIRATLQAQNQQKALQTFVTSFTKKWTARTSCRSGFVVQDCKEYKAPKTAAPAGTTG